MGKRFHLVISIFTILCFVSQSTLAQSNSKADFGKMFGNKTGSSVRPEIDGRKAPQGKSKTKKSEFDQEAQDCDKEAKEAAKQCDDKTNQSSQQAQGQNDQYNQQQQQSQGSSAGGGQGAQGECGGLGDLMKAIEPLLKQAGGQCKAANEKCKSSCKKTQQGASKCAGVPIDDQAACNADAQQNQKFGQDQEKSCGAQDQNAAAFMQAAMQAAMTAMQMAKCKKDSELDCSKPENAEQEKCGGKKPLDCSKPEGAKDPKCICQMNPRNPGCPGSENANDVANAAKIKKDRSSSSTPDSPSSSDSGTDATPSKPGSSGGLPFAPGGGGGGGGGKGADSAKGPELGGVKGMSADVLAGDYGGGGGGAKAVGGGYPDGDPRGQALAKAKKAMERRLASQGSWTGANGRSNWEKIKDRYRDNRPSLLSTER
jgi:hypothetical protein